MACNWPSIGHIISSTFFVFRLRSGKGAFPRRTKREGLGPTSEGDLENRRAYPRRGLWDAGRARKREGLGPTSEGDLKNRRAYPRRSLQDAGRANHKEGERSEPGGSARRAPRVEGGRRPTSAEDSEGVRRARTRGRPKAGHGRNTETPARQSRRRGELKGGPWPD